MSFNKKIISNPKKLQDFLKENGSTEFYLMYLKGIDAMSGDKNGITFIEKFEKKYYESNSEFYELD
jgi:hypothetical protein